MYFKPFYLFRSEVRLTETLRDRQLIAIDLLTPQGNISLHVAQVWQCSEISSEVVWQSDHPLKYVVIH